MPSLRDRTTWLLGDRFHCLASPPLSSTPSRLVLLGPPGVGKGTQAALLARALGTCGLSTGDVFREAFDREFAPGSATALVHERLNRGQLVPDDIVIGLVRNRRACFRCGNGFILDGFPRTTVQATALDGLLAAERLQLDAVIHYLLPLPELVARLSGRRVCLRCHAVYHVTTRPPARAGECDHCGGFLVRRPADEPAAQQARLGAHMAATAQVAAHYERQGLVVPVDADQTPAEIFTRTLELLAARGIKLPRALGVPNPALVEVGTG